uniref:Uncharacterized protein n=1 Tax=Ananas comosus var. bracteatus TaxID=296719 RepID=A0A6V7NYZ0_ANACO|nr:unnamed protein product [Ananas comosus var. bracteatus]
MSPPAPTAPRASSPSYAGPLLKELSLKRLHGLDSPLLVLAPIHLVPDLPTPPTRPIPPPPPSPLPFEHKNERGARAILVSRVPPRSFAAHDSAAPFRAMPIRLESASAGTRELDDDDANAEDVGGGGGGGGRGAGGSAGRQEGQSAGIGGGAGR